METLKPLSPNWLFTSAAFLDAIVPHLPQEAAHFNKRCIRVVSGPTKVTLEFADGTAAETDVVLGADGIKRVVREVVTGTDSYSALKWSNTVCYRGLVPIQAVRAAGVERDFAARPVCYVGKDKVSISWDISV